MDEQLGLVFPGQGSQAVGMLEELAADYPVVAETFTAAGEALGQDLWSLVRNGPAEEINRTEVTQPVMLAAGVACWRAWRQAGGAVPGRMAGHSLGEYTALVCADAIGFEDAVRLVRDRARFMQEAVPEGQGLMAAVMGLDDATVANCCQQAAQGETVEPVNFNAPGQVVIAGNTAAVRRALEAAREAGAKRAQELAVSVPSHCALMKPAAERLADRLGEVSIGHPVVSVIHNTDAAISDDANAIRQRLGRQLYTPVRWVETIEAMKNGGVQRLIEAGPGKVLAGLNRRIDRRMPIQPVFDRETLNTALEQ
jgi:[acyl-carrier-protein] S-malonyltransferase